MLKRKSLRFLKKETNQMGETKARQEAAQKRIDEAKSNK